MPTSLIVPIHAELVKMNPTVLPHLQHPYWPHYQPLSKKRKDIRLLIVEPGHNLSPLRCRIQHAALDPLDPDVLPRYETISYTWGDSPAKAYIGVNGYSMKVAATSAAALRQMRRESHDRLLWIDAVCINQNDNEEKAEQVASMDQTYRMSVGNLIHLGEDVKGIAPETAKALLAFKIWFEEQIEQLLPQNKAEFRRGVIPSAWSDRRMPPDEYLLAACPVYECPWFR